MCYFNIIQVDLLRFVAVKCKPVPIGNSTKKPLSHTLK